MNLQQILANRLKQLQQERQENKQNELKDYSQTENIRIPERDIFILAYGWTIRNCSSVDCWTARTYRRFLLGSSCYVLNTFKNGPAEDFYFYLYSKRVWSPREMLFIIQNLGDIRMEVPLEFYPILEDILRKKFP